MSGVKGRSGRQTIKTPELCEEICRRLAEGEPLAQICRDEEMPAQTTVNAWVESDSDFNAAFARARNAGFDRIALDALRIADTPLDGLTEELEPDSAGDMKVIKRRREDMLGHRKLQVETRLKLLAKWDPKRYGERLELDAAVQHSVDATKTAETLEAILSSNGFEK